MTGELVTVRKNTIYSAITIFSRLFANVFIFWLLARFYGPEQFGIFTFAHALATTFIILADFGLDVLLITEIAAHPERKKEVINKLFGIKLIFVISAFLLMLLVSQIFPIGRKHFLLIFAFGFYLVFTSINNLLFGVFRGFEKFIFESRVAFISNLFLILLSLLFLYLKVDLIYIALVFMFTRSFGTALSFFYLTKVYKEFRFRFDLTDIDFLKNKTLIFGLHLIFSYLFFQVDTLLLAKLSGEYSVGIYQSVIKLIMLPLVIPDILTNALMPTLSRVFRNSENEWLKLGGFMGRILIMVVVPVSILFLFYSDEIINFVYGLNRFAEAVFVLKIFGIILLVRFLLEPFALMLTTSNRQKIRLITVILATALNIVLNLHVIPKYGVNGAAVVSLIVNSFVGLSYFWFASKGFTYWLFNYKNLILLIFSFAVIFLLQQFLSINFVIAVMIFISLYIIFVVFFYLSKTEQDLLKSLVKKFSF